MSGNKAHDLLQRIDRILRDPTQRIDRGMLEHARQGDTPEASRWLMSRLADHLSGGIPLTADVLEALVQALRDVSDGADADRALWLKPSKGKKSRRLNAENARIRDPLLYLEVARLVAEGMQPTRNPLTETECACGIVADRNGLPYEIVKNAYYEHRPR